MIPRTLQIFKIRFSTSYLCQFNTYCTAPLPLTPRKTQAEGHTKQHFVDYRRVRVKGGNGGDGCLSFLSMPRKEWAGPDGGDGGNGGHVIFIADENEVSLEKMSHSICAEEGVKGRKNSCHGRNAQHTYIKVPLGTLIKAEESQETLHDLKESGEMFVAGRGGAGGHGNRYFLSNENRAPTVYEEGGLGEERMLMVELRIMAHAGLVGFPNAGKSTLLRAISRARPKVAAYPFTTLNPHVGMVQYEDLLQLAVADIPGLVRGAHLNYGLGFSFLRHIERCRCLLYVLDLAAPDPPHEQLANLKYELEQYAPGLSERRHVIVGNKQDLPHTGERLEELRDRLGEETKVFGVSAKKKEGVVELLMHLRELYEQKDEEDIKDNNIES